ncbi:hypothetical protein ABIA31_005700 [Catenulispora sp. MAP5-51]|uniref:DUF3068 domain-containing protein n=1 Tax=Catenulispora sp. MAP5-51 TaxID=3156298 RepID=UPI003516D29A
MTKTRIACAVVGVLSLVAAALMAWWITPSYVARVPSDKNISRNYAGTFETLLDPQALAAGNLLGAIKQKVPMTVAQDVKVESTSGNTALVSDSRTTEAAGAKVEQTKWQYAVDRKSLEAVTSHPSSWNVIPAKGLTVSWPFGAQKKNYEGWTPETQTTTPLTYLRSEQKQGITTYVYEAKVAPTKIVDSQILAALPKQLPGSLLKLLATAGNLPAAQAAQLAQLLPTLPAEVPMAYTFQDDSTFWVDPDTGLVIDVQRNQQRIAAIALPTGTLVPLIPAVAATYETTPASQKQAADDASNGSNVISWLGVYIPIILLVLGVVLLALTAFLFWRGRRRGPTVPPAPTAGPGPAAGPGPEATHP